MKVCFAPDYRQGVPYQQLLADALGGCGVEVEFTSGYRRILPLWRNTKDRTFDLLHLHWPEAFYPRRGDMWDGFRRWRFPFDLMLASKKRPYVLTAHNHFPHDREEEPGVARNVRMAYQNARRIIFHSKSAREILMEKYKLDPRRCAVVPPGDLSQVCGAPVEPNKARHLLELSDAAFCLMFGSIAPYKGIDEVMGQWLRQQIQTPLYIVGAVNDPGYLERLQALAAQAGTVKIVPGRLDNNQLNLWLSAAGCVLVNYRAILNSGAVCTARAWGVPLLLPKRLQTTDLLEPSRYVLRFGRWDDFPGKLEEALKLAPNYAAAADWRAVNDWNQIAKITVEIYRQSMEED